MTDGTPGDTADDTAGVTGNADRPRVGTVDLEDLRGARLDEGGRGELLAAQTECTFVFSDADGAPAAVVLSFAHHGERFWFTSVDGRAQVRGVERDPRVCVVVSNAGTALPGRRMLSVRGNATVHRDPARVEAMLPVLAGRLAPDNVDSFVRLLRSPRRVVIELESTEIVASHDSRRMAGDGRGGP